jgi:hypothetical protein
MTTVWIYVDTRYLEATTNPGLFVKIRLLDDGNAVSRSAPHSRDLECRASAGGDSGIRWRRYPAPLATCNGRAIQRTP